MKREGHVYERMADWETIVEAERVSTKRKQKNFGVKKHKKTRWENLCEIQQKILSHQMKTGTYRMDEIVSGQDKLRDIAKLHFHPSHIQHQLLVIVSEERIEQSLIRHTYASRKGYGQVRAALRIKKYLAEHKSDALWYGQGDIIKYYENTRHSLLRENLERIFKDKAFVDAYMEPFEVFAPDGIGIPLGIRPSQSAGNIALMAFDRFSVEELQCKGYTRFLDDFVFFGKTKGEVKRKMKRMEAYLKKNGYELHPPKIHRVSEGLDMLGYIFNDTPNSMWWRKADKRRWLKRRYHVTNPKRLREIDDAAWGMLKWGNRHGRRLWKIKTKKEFPNQNKMAIKYRQSGIAPTERTDKNGVPFINEPSIGMKVLTTSGQPVEVDKCLKGIHTTHGDGRYVLRVLFNGIRYKLFVNAPCIKDFLDAMEHNHVTRFRTVFVDEDRGHYAIDEERTDILEVNGRTVTEHNGEAFFEDTGEKVNFV